MTFRIPDTVYPKPQIMLNARRKRPDTIKSLAYFFEFVILYKIVFLLSFLNRFVINNIKFWDKILL